MLGTQLKAGPFLKRVADELLRIDPAEVQALADAMFDAYKAGRMIFLAGNGGSGSTPRTSARTSASAPSNCRKT